MRTFLVTWSGQLLSVMGSYMTVFAVILWVWQITGSATALTTLTFFSLLPRIPMTTVGRSPHPLERVERWHSLHSPTPRLTGHDHYLYLIRYPQ